MLILYMEPRKRNPIETKRTKVFKKRTHNRTLAGVWKVKPTKARDGCLGTRSRRKT